MSDLGHHGEWLSLLDVSGPFLAEPVLKEALPQGLQGLDPIVKKEVRQAYDEWREALDFEEKDLAKLQRAWISFVLGRVLGYGADFILTGEKITTGYRHVVPENGVALLPDVVVTEGKTGGKSLLLVKTYEAHVPLSDALSGDAWAASPIERMIELCRATGVRLGLVTNGEQWTLVDAPVGAVVSIASWYARLWSQEPLTLQAFAELLNIRRFFGGSDAELTTLLDKSLTLQDEVTDALGEQVRRAVEVLVQSLDRADQDRNRELLKDVSPEELYEAGLTIMMRVVFLLSAEERGLLLLGDRHYEENYAVSTLRGQLRQEADEVLERRWDAWSRLLSLFRAVFAGVDHNTMRMPALGGSLFDPDRFPFLEGRSKGSNWKSDTAVPLPIDNRTVLLLLEAVQLYQGRALSYLALDVEQIGYVYEGLLERTVVRANEVTLDLKATKNAKAPWVKLSELDDAAAKSGSAIEELLKDKTGSSANRVRNDLAKTPDETESGKLLAACDGDINLRDRIKPYFHLLRTDSWGYPLVYPKDTFMVASGSDRRETGTHYTPKSFTETIVKTTLEPLVYDGPAEGLMRGEWRLRSVDVILDLKICDPAMGSGAFLVQVCRYMADRVVEAWAEAERSGKSISADGDVKDDLETSEALSKDADERTLTAKRIIAERCLYGVDVNPLAVELAKLSLWMVTLAKNRPFGFLDHNLRSGDSLLGITKIDQVFSLKMKPTGSSTQSLFVSDLRGAVADAVNLRMMLRARLIRDITDVHFMEQLEKEARLKLSLPLSVANALLGSYLAYGMDSFEHSALLAVSVGEAVNDNAGLLRQLERDAERDLNVGLPEGKRRRRPFHWPLEFPEVFGKDRFGFDAFVGNPPFSGGQKITGTLGTNYRNYLISQIAFDERGSADLVTYFLLRSYSLLYDQGYFGLLAVKTIAEGDTRRVGLEQLLNKCAGTIFSAEPSEPWSGAAAVRVSRIHLSKGTWSGAILLSGQPVEYISGSLSSEREVSPRQLISNRNLSFQGSIPLGAGFLVGPEDADNLFHEQHVSTNVLKKYLTGDDVLSFPPDHRLRHVIDFGSKSEDEARSFPQLFDILEQKVKPVRAKDKRKARREKWWIFAERAPSLYEAIADLKQVLFHPFTSKYVAFSMVPASWSFAGPHVVIASDSYALFARMQSLLFATWSYRWCSTHETRMRFAPSDIFETFPFISLKGAQNLDMLGCDYHTLRKQIMKARSIGLTEFYNLFHDAECSERDISQFRDLQEQMDRAVLAEFSWNDCRLSYEFRRLVQRNGEVACRYTIADDVSRELLRRLSQNNNARAIEQSDVKLAIPSSMGLESFELKISDSDPKANQGRRSS